MDPFISVDDLNAFTGGTYQAMDLLTQIALDSACQAVRDELGQEINLRRNDTVFLDGTGKQALLLPELPVIEVVSVIENDTELTVDTDYIVGRYGVLYRLGSTIWSLGAPWWFSDRGNIAVTYDHGWAIGEEDVNDDDDDDSSGGLAIDRVPSTIRLVALELAAAVVKAPTLTSVGAGGITSETLGAYSYTVNPNAAAQFVLGSMTLEQRQKLNRWRPGAV